jgi:DNA-binding NarL/FixJ family response regulator
MTEQSIRLGPREQQVTELLLQGCGNADIARELKMAPRTVKAHFSRLFLRFGIRDGIRRVKLATLLYRMRVSEPTNVVEPRPQSEQERTVNASPIPS